MFNQRGGGTNKFPKHVSIYTTTYLENYLGNRLLREEINYFFPVLKLTTNFETEVNYELILLLVKKKHVSDIII